MGDPKKEEMMKNLVKFNVIMLLIVLVLSLTIVLVVSDPNKKFEEYVKDNCGNSEEILNNTFIGGIKYKVDIINYNECVLSVYEEEIKIIKNGK